MYPAMNHQQGDMHFFITRLPEEIDAFASGKTYGIAGKRKYSMSTAMQERYRLAMAGKGWLSTKDVSTAIGVTRKAAGYALSKILHPQGCVEQRPVSERRNEYRWKDSPQPN